MIQKNPTSSVNSTPKRDNHTIDTKQRRTAIRCKDMKDSKQYSIEKLTVRIFDQVILKVTVY